MAAATLSIMGAAMNEAPEAGGSQRTVPSGSVSQSVAPSFAASETTKKATTRRTRRERILLDVVRRIEGGGDDDDLLNFCRLFMHQF